MNPKGTLSPSARKEPLPGAAGGAADANVAAAAMTMASAAARGLIASCDSGSRGIEAISSSPFALTNRLHTRTEYADTPHSLGLLGTRAERQRRCRAAW